MIKDDVLVFDCVAHPCNFDPQNAFGKPGEPFINHLYAFHQVLTPENEPKPPSEDFSSRSGTPPRLAHGLRRVRHRHARRHALPLTNLFEDGLWSWERCVELRDQNPDRTVFWGTVNPLEGKKALDLMEVQVKEYGAEAFKFYNVRYDYGELFPGAWTTRKWPSPSMRRRWSWGSTSSGCTRTCPWGRSR